MASKARRASGEILLPNSDPMTSRVVTVPKLPQTLQMPLTLTRPKLEDIFICMARHNVSITELCMAIIDCQFDFVERHRENLTSGLTRIIDNARLSSETAREKLYDYFFSRIKRICIKEMLELSKKSTGFHLGATTLTEDKLDIFKLPQLVTKYRTTAATLWELVCAVLQAHPRASSLHETKTIGSDISILEEHSSEASLELSEEEEQMWEALNLDDIDSEGAGNVPNEDVPLSCPNGALAAPPATSDDNRKERQKLKLLRKKEVIYCIVSACT